VALGLPVLAVGTVVAAAGLAVGGRRSARSRYRPDRWGTSEWLVSGSGIVAAAAALAGAGLDPAAMQPSTAPLLVPPLPVVPLLGLLVALLPAWASPAPEATGDGAGDTGGAGRAGRDTGATPDVPTRPGVAA
jgi:energy-coupling factor transport system permease protein